MRRGDADLEPLSRRDLQPVATVLIGVKRASAVFGVVIWSLLSVGEAMSAATARPPVTLRPSRVDRSEAGWQKGSRPVRARCFDWIAHCFSSHLHHSIGPQPLVAMLAAIWHGKRIQSCGTTASPRQPIPIDQKSARFRAARVEANGGRPGKQLSCGRCAWHRTPLPNSCTIAATASLASKWIAVRRMAVGDEATDRPRIGARTNRRL